MAAGQRRDSGDGTGKEGEPRRSVACLGGARYSIWGWVLGAGATPAGNESGAVHPRDPIPVRPHPEGPSTADPTPLNAGIASGKTYEERVGAPDSVTSALGHVVLAFSWLEQIASRVIVGRLRADELAGYTVAAELSFGSKIHLIASLARLRDGDLERPDPAPIDPTRLDGVVAECFRAEELRNRLMHSFWESVPLQPDQMVRFKRSAKARHGLRDQVETVDAAAILDVADFIDHAASGLELLFAPPPTLL